MHGPSPSHRFDFLEASSLPSRVNDVLACCRRQANPPEDSTARADLPHDLPSRRLLTPRPLDPCPTVDIDASAAAVAAFMAAPFSVDPGVGGDDSSDGDSLEIVSGRLHGTSISDRQLQTVPASTTISTTSTTSTPTTPTRFPLFGRLPTELRLKIWQLSFEPRTVEIHRRKSHYADTYYHESVYSSTFSHGIGGGGNGGGGGGHGGMAAATAATPGLAKWQSWSANPAALAVSHEARGCALEHYTATIRLAVNTPCERSGEARLDLHRRLYLAPQADTLVMLGEFHVAQTAELLRHIASQDTAHAGPGGRTRRHAARSLTVCSPTRSDRSSSSSSNSSCTSSGSNRTAATATTAATTISTTSPSSSCPTPSSPGLRRLALCASSIGHPGASILLNIYSRTIFLDLDQLVLFLYDERVPPAAWKDGECALVHCRDTYQFRRFQVGQGVELKYAPGSSRWMTVGRGPLDVLDLAFGRDAIESGQAAAAVPTTMATTIEPPRAATPSLFTGFAGETPDDGRHRNRRDGSTVLPESGSTTKYPSSASTVPLLRVDHDSLDRRTAWMHDTRQW